jgi:pimeloyl-ACP methyl ester carboxylesterase
MWKRLALIIALTLGTVDSVKAAEITVDGPLGPLFGTFINKGPDAPIVLIIPGSGVVDRNGLSPNALGIGMYRSTAHRLADDDISSLRIDKRGIFASESAVQGFEDLRIAKYADDIARWVHELRHMTGAKCIWLLGHSEGGLVGSVAIARDPIPYCGIILAASPGRSIDLVLHDQLTMRTKSKRIMRLLDSVIESLRVGETVPKEHIPIMLRPMFSSVNQEYYIDWMRYQPTDIISDFKGPVLIVQGTNDKQILISDAEMLSTATPQAKVVILDGVNHVFQKTDLTFPPSSLGVSEDFIERVSKFIEANK